MSLGLAVVILLLATSHQTQGQGQEGSQSQAKAHDESKRSDFASLYVHSYPRVDQWDVTSSEDSGSRRRSEILKQFRGKVDAGDSFGRVLKRSTSSDGYVNGPQLMNFENQDESGLIGEESSDKQIDPSQSETIRTRRSLGKSYKGRSPNDMLTRTTRGIFLRTSRDFHPMTYYPYGFDPMWHMYFEPKDKRGNDGSSVWLRSSRSDRSKANTMFLRASRWPSSPVHRRFERSLMRRANILTRGLRSVPDDEHSLRKRQVMSNECRMNPDLCPGARQDLKDSELWTRTLRSVNKYPRNTKKTFGRVTRDQDNSPYDFYTRSLRSESSYKIDA